MRQNPSVAGNLPPILPVSSENAPNRAHARLTGPLDQATDKATYEKRVPAGGDPFQFYSA
jgi:hypothetical protein